MLMGAHGVMLFSSAAFSAEPTRTSDAHSGPAIYFADYFEEGGRNFIHWKFNDGRKEWIELRLPMGPGRPLQLSHDRTRPSIRTVFRPAAH